MKTETQEQARIRPCTFVFALLVCLTLVTWGVGRAGLGGLCISLMVFGFALLKGQLIGDWFMGLRGIRGFWRWIVLIWLLVPGLLVTTAFLLAGRSG
jgi:hypothetical protein